MLDKFFRLKNKIIRTILLFKKRRITLFNKHSNISLKARLVQYKSYPSFLFITTYILQERSLPNSPKLKLNFSNINEYYVTITTQLVHNHHILETSSRGDFLIFYFFLEKESTCIYLHIAPNHRPTFSRIEISRNLQLRFFNFRKERETRARPNFELTNPC